MLGGQLDSDKEIWDLSTRKMLDFSEGRFRAG
jgi:hypothetical protein